MERQPASQLSSRCSKPVISDNMRRDFSFRKVCNLEEPMHMGADCPRRNKCGFQGCKRPECIENITNQSMIEAQEEILQNISMESYSDESCEICEDGKRRPALGQKGKTKE